MQTLLAHISISAVLRAVSEGQYSKPKGLKTKLLLFKQTTFSKKKKKEQQIKGKRYYKELTPVHYLHSGYSLTLLLMLCWQ